MTPDNVPGIPDGSFTIPYTPSSYTAAISDLVLIKIPLKVSTTSATVFEDICT